MGAKNGVASGVPAPIFQPPMSPKAMAMMLWMWAHSSSEVGWRSGGRSAMGCVGAAGVEEEVGGLYQLLFAGSGQSHPDSVRSSGVGVVMGEVVDGVAPTALARFWEPISSPFRAGLMFGERPSGPLSMGQSRQSLTLP